jgi:H+/Cl- antiporter ClcA
MTGDHAMVIPLMAAALIADQVSKMLSRHGLYHTLAEQFLVPRPKDAAPSAP